MWRKGWFFSFILCFGELVQSRLFKLSAEIPYVGVSEGLISPPRSLEWYLSMKSKIHLNVNLLKLYFLWTGANLITETAFVLIWLVNCLCVLNPIQMVCIYCIYPFALSIGDSVVLEQSVLGHHVKEEQGPVLKNSLEGLHTEGICKAKLIFKYILWLLRDLTVGPYKGLTCV